MVAHFGLSVFNLNGLDPVGSSVPKVLNKDIKIKQAFLESSVALLCQGQGFPPPKYRSL